MRAAPSATLTDSGNFKIDRETNIRLYISEVDSLFKLFISLQFIENPPINLVSVFLFVCFFSIPT